MVDRRQVRIGALSMVLVSAFAMSVTRPSHGADPPAPIDPPNGTATLDVSPVEPPNGEIYVVGTQVQFEGLRDVIGRERVGPVAARWLRLDRFDPHTVLAASGTVGVHVRCWIDLGVPERASLYFADRSSEHFLVREVPLPNGLTEIEKETLAQVVEMSIEAITGNAAFSLSRDHVQALLRRRTPQPPAHTRVVPPGPAVAATRIRWQRVIGAYYQLESHSPQLPWVHAPGAEIGIARRSATTKLTLTMRVGYQVPEVYRSNLAALRLSALRLRSQVAFDVALDAGDAITGQEAPYFGVMLSAGAHLLFAEPQSGRVSNHVEVASATSFFVPTLGLGCRATQPFGTWAISLGFLADIDLQRVSYDVEQEGRRIPIVRSHSVRPSIILEIGWL